MPYVEDCIVDSFTNTTGAQAKVNCGDQRDTIITEYVTYGVGLSPACPDFTQSRHSAYFSFGEINTGDFSWALVKDALIAAESSGYGLDKWRSNYGAARIVNSSYRNPVPATPGSLQLIP